MKKNLFQLMALLMALCLMLCACGIASDEGDKKSDEDSIVGTWVGTVDCTDYFEDMMAETMGEELAGYFTWKDLGFDVVITFDDDGEYTMELEKDSVEEFADDAISAMTDGLYAYLEASLASTLGDQSLDAYLSDNGMTFDSLMSSMGMDLDALADEIVAGFEETATSGEYEIDGDELDMDGDICEFKLKGDSLTIYAPEEVDEDTDAEMMDVIFPLEMERED